MVISLPTVTVGLLMPNSRRERLLCILLTIEISEQLEGMFPADQEGLIDCKGPISLLLQRGEEQLIFFSRSFRLKESFRIDKRVNLVVG